MHCTAQTRSGHRAILLGKQAGSMTALSGQPDWLAHVADQKGATNNTCFGFVFYREVCQSRVPLKECRVVAHSADCHTHGEGRTTAGCVVVSSMYFLLQETGKTS